MKELMKKYSNKRQCLTQIPFAFLYAVFMVWTKWDILGEAGAVAGFVRFFAWAAAAYVILLALCAVIAIFQDSYGEWLFRGKKSGEESQTIKRQPKRYLYAVFFLLCVVCWLPYFLLYYPGWISNDSVWQLEQACGWVSGSNHHPYAHTMVIRLFFMLGFRLFGTYTEACAVYTAAQILIMAGVYSFLLGQLYRRGTSPAGIVLAVLFYALLPINGLYAICMGKDVLFAGALLLYAWFSGVLSVRMARKREIQTGTVILYSGLGLAVCLLRSNGILVFLGTSFVMGILCLVYRSWKKLLPAMGAVLVCFLVWQGPVLSALEVEKGDTIESLAMPVQQILDAYLNGGTLTEEEAALLNTVIPMDTAASYYNPYFFDIVKNYIREAGNQEVIAEKKGEFLKLWIQVGLRNPGQYLDAVIKQTQGYFAFRTTDYQYLYEQYLMAENPFEMTTQRKLFSYDFGLAAEEFLLRFQDFYNKVWSIGMNTWLLFFAFAYAAYRGKNIVPFVPYALVLLSLLLAAPACAEFRYTYGVFTALPILLGWSFGRRKDRREEPL